MKRTTLSLLIAGSLACGSQFAMAQQQQPPGERFANQLYFGGGLNFNSLDDYDDALGYQVFVGWQPNYRIGELNGGIEVGYWNSGDFERTGFPDETAEGLWATAVGTMPITDNWRALARAGADFGDDDGPLFGVGVGYDATPSIAVRGEYVLRDDTDSLQLNVVWRPYQPAPGP